MDCIPGVECRMNSVYYERFAIMRIVKESTKRHPLWCSNICVRVNEESWRWSSYFFYSDSYIDNLVTRARFTLLATCMGKTNVWNGAYGSPTYINRHTSTRKDFDPQPKLVLIFDRERMKGLVGLSKYTSDYSRLLRAENVSPPGCRDLNQRPIQIQKPTR